MHEALAAAAFQVAAVDAVYPEPIPIEDKFSVLMLTGIRPEERRSFEQVEGNIRIREAQNRRNEAILALRRSLRDRAKVSIDGDAVAAFELDLPGAPAPDRRPSPAAQPTSPFAPRRGATPPSTGEGRRETPPTSPQ